MAPDSGRSRRRDRVLLVVLLALAFAARAAWGLLQPTTDEAIDRLPDQREYLSLAQNVLSGNGLQFYDRRFNEQVYAFRTPGYPFFIAALSARVTWVRVAQAAVDTSTVLAAYLLAVALLRSDRPRRVGLFAAGLVAVNPFLVYFSALLLSETLFTAMLAWGMLLLAVGGRGARLRPDPNGPPPRRGLGTVLWLAGGLLLALSALVRPSAAPLAVLLGIGAAFANRPKRVNRAGDASYETGRDAVYSGADAGPKWPLPVGSTMVLLTVLVLLPWMLRNYKVLQTLWIWTTTNEGVTLYDGFNPDATGASDQSFLRSMHQLGSMGEVGRSEYLSLKAKEYVRRHPGRAAQLAAIKAGRTWSPVPLSEQFGSRRNRLIAAMYAVPFFGLVLYGLTRDGLRRSAKVFLLLPAIYFTAVHVMSVGSLRYRIPVEPPLAVIAASVFARTPLSWRRAEREMRKT